MKYVSPPLLCTGAILCTGYLNRCGSRITSLYEGQVSLIPRKKKSSLIQQCDAPVYCNCSLNTLKAHVARGNLPPPEEKDNRKYWKSDDLDVLKIKFLQPYAGKRGRRPVLAAKHSGETKDAEQTETIPPTALATLPTVEAGLAIAVGIPPNVTQKQAEVMLRGQLLEMAQKNRVIKKLFDHVDSESPSISLKGIEMVLNRLVPSLKTIQTHHTEDESVTERQGRTLKALEIIADRMQGKMIRETGPVEAEYRVIDDAR